MEKQSPKAPKVSVVSPVFNCENCLPEFIESILSQTLRDWELILVDDGSEDSSAEIAKRYEKKDRRITSVLAKHSSAGSARNIGLEIAKGEYICFFDSENYCKPEMLEKMVTAAQEKNADIVFCQADQYSENAGITNLIPWSLPEQNIPVTKDGCYNRRSCSGFLFQTTIISPCNKMMRLQLLRDNSIKAQSQIAANDVVLCGTALACAERIYPLRESLYVQRHDNDFSITARPDTKETYMCGYTSALGLMRELQRTGHYEKVKESFQRIAVHHCIWYLEKCSNNKKLYDASYLFLQSEGFANLGLDDLYPGLPDESKDMKAFLEVRDTPLYVHYENELQQVRRGNAKLKKMYEELKTSRDYRVGCFVMKGPNALIAAYNRLKAWHPVGQYKEYRRYRGANKRIAFFAFEAFHYDVLENMMRICNMEENYIIAYVQPTAKKEVSELLGEPGSKIEWHTFKEPNLKKCPKDKLEKAEWISLFIKDAQARKNLDIVVVPSPEYHANWYMDLALAPNKKYRLIAGVHNLNTVFHSNVNHNDMKSFFEKADEFAVIGSTLKDCIVKNQWNNGRPTRVFPQIYSPAEPHKMPKAGERVTFVITGIVDESRKDYQSVVDALRTIPELHPQLRIVLLGKAVSVYAKKIVAQLEEMRKTGLETISYPGYVPIQDFRRLMDEADYLLGPIVIETGNKGVRECYGETKISGIVGDIIRYARPALINGWLRLPEELKDSVIAYKTEEEMSKAFGKLIDRATLSKYCDRAQKNSEKFLLKDHIWSKERE